MKSIGRELDPERTDAAGTVSSVIAIKATEELKVSATGDDAQKMLEAGHEIEFAVYQGKVEEYTRFPRSGYIKGTMRDLVDFMRPASEPQEAIDLATTAFREGVQDTATWILDAAKGTNIGDLIAEKLRQPWPAYPAKPLEKKKDIDQEKTDQNARAQTARMTAAILINALAYQQNLGRLFRRSRNRREEGNSHDQKPGPDPEANRTTSGRRTGRMGQHIVHKLLANFPYCKAAADSHPSNDSDKNT